jgi:alkylhydroperoxidase/carboxymuconolactone decarboxylase family protein YurZ
VPAKEPSTSSERQREDLLRRLALNDESTVEAVLGVDIADLGASSLGPRTAALLRLAALVATESPRASYQWGVGVALAAGASEDEIVDLLLVLAPIVGVARVNAAAPEVGVALGYAMDTEV